MSLTSQYLNRRRFMKTAAPLLGFGLTSLRGIPVLPFRSQDGEHSWKKVIDDLLTVVNAERSVVGASRLEFDTLASQVASVHAKDMATGDFVNHWGRDGRKPYHRYAFAGGIHATEENVASVDNLQSTTWKDIENQVVSAHLRMHAETPPNDGHRLTILAPQHTHVGFGIALYQHRLRLVELFVGKYVEVDQYPQRAKRKSIVDLSGRILGNRYELQQVDVFYEPLPKPLDQAALSRPESYGLPDEYRALRPKLSNLVRYADGTFGEVEVNGSAFRVPVKLYKSEPGIYTVVAWIRMKYSRKAFPATEICIESE